MSRIKGIPAYWKKILFEVCGMVKQVGLPTFFMALSCADLQWDKLVFIIGKLKGKRLTSERISSMDYFERCGYLNFIQFYLHVNFSVELKPSLKWSIS